MNKKLDCKGYRHIVKCGERFVKRKPNLNFMRVLKNSSFDQNFVYTYIFCIYGPNLPKKFYSLLRKFSHLSFSHLKDEIFQFWQCYHTIKQTYLSDIKSFSLMDLVCSAHYQGFEVFLSINSSFRSLLFHVTP